MKAAKEAMYTYVQIEMMAYGHQALDGTYDVIVGTGENQKVVKQLYKLGTLRLPLAENANILQNAMENFNKARKAVFEEHAEEGKKEIPAEDKPRLEAFQTAEEKLRNSEVPLTLNRIDVLKLDLDNNPIPITAVKMLAPILDNFG